MKKIPYQPPNNGHELFFQFGLYDPDVIVTEHQHAFGQLVYCTCGIMEISSSRFNFVSPPHYAVWIPPHTHHRARFRQRVEYQSVYIAPARCDRLPQEPCVLAITPLIKALLSEFMRRQLNIAGTDKEQRMAHVLVDLLEETQILTSYLPSAQNPILQPMLLEMSTHPGATTTLAEWAITLNLTERTLIRKFIQDTGLTYGEWKRRARFLAAISHLKSGMTVEAVALTLGYSTSSAFIAMFKRECGKPPEQFRREMGDR
ncbi:AraC family transcriptional regulator [Pseudomonas fluorescens]